MEERRAREEKIIEQRAAEIATRTSAPGWEEGMMEECARCKHGRR
jgi:hypothetical protein